MGMFDLEFRIQGVPGFRAAINTFESGIRNLQFLWPIVAAHFYQIEKEQFASEGGRSHAWAALSSRYGAWKSAHFPGKPILQRLGFLVTSLTARGAQFGIYEEGAMFLRLGTERPGAAAHQRTRPPIDLTAADFQFFGSILQGGVDSVARSAGFQVVHAGGFNIAGLH